MTEKKISCDEVHEHLCVNLDEDLNSPDCRAVKLHLNECPDCAAYLKSLKNTIHLYQKYPSPRPSSSPKNAIDAIIRKSTDPDCDK